MKKVLPAVLAELEGADNKEVGQLVKAALESKKD